MEWFVRKILVDNYLEQYKEKLGNIPSSYTLDPPEKTVQYPAHAMHLKVSVNDDNIAIVKSLKQQVGTSPEWYQSFVRLCHDDLGTQERHDATTESHAIESTPQEQLQFLVTILGAFIFGWLVWMPSGKFTSSQRPCMKSREGFLISSRSSTLRIHQNLQVTQLTTCSMMVSNIF